MTLTKINTASHVEMLAKLYSEGKPAQSADETIAQLCNWLMSEFQQLQNLRKDTRYGKNPMELHGERWRLELPS